MWPVYLVGSLGTTGFQARGVTEETMEDRELRELFTALLPTGRLFSYNVIVLKGASASHLVGRAGGHERQKIIPTTGRAAEDVAC